MLILSVETILHRFDVLVDGVKSCVQVVVVGLDEVFNVIMGALNSFVEVFGGRVGGDWFGRHCDR